MNKVELLAPAGSYESFLGAISAGADAVYLGGMKYGARAFAENFDEESLCRAIYYAHLFDRKVYLTLNTLMKQEELEEIETFLSPFYEAGLDGVIVQDLGLFSLLKKKFPLLELHISTQMAVTGPEAVKFLKEEGAVRIVPARELSLEEIKRLKSEGLEIETFIHGAMCYCYSGQCFFSSFLGGRSGNRGKCAQSCRLPYQVETEQTERAKKQKEEYPLSLKDMCSIALLPELIEAGIDSFKIEGRMKRPEYVAGVTSIYRKYIDLYETKGAKGFKVSKEDMGILKSLYIRTDLQDGYYKRHNGKEMVTIHKPSYCGIDEKLAESVYEKYVKDPLKAKVTGTAILKKGSPMSLKVCFKEIEIFVEGVCVEEAKKRPMEKHEVEKQLLKTGNTDFVFEALEIIMDEDVFVGLKALNELRRQAFECLEREIIAQVLNERRKSRLEGMQRKEDGNTSKEERIMLEESSTEQKKLKENPLLHVCVSTWEQCQKALEIKELQRIYVASDLILEDRGTLISRLKEASEDREVWIRLPEVLRNKDAGKIEEILQKCEKFAKGMLISNLESYAWLKEYGYRGEISLNYHVYLWNRETLNFWKDKINSFLMPVECNYHEWKKLQNEKAEYLCYGKIPMMVTANCIRKTKGACRGKGVSGKERIIDRYHKEFGVQINCNYCYNVIYNSVPLSLHPYLEQILELKGKAVRLDFTLESAEEMDRVLKEYILFMKQKETGFSFLKEYTTGHYKKGAL